MVYFSEARTGYINTTTNNAPLNPSVLKIKKIPTETLRERGLQIFLETSGSHPFSGVFDWVCLSPKRRQPPLDEAFERADELKVIVESEEDFEWAERNAARVGGKCLLFLQPEWSVAEKVMPAIVEYAKAHPRWNISIQTHKYMHIP